MPRLWLEQLELRTVDWRARELGSVSQRTDDFGSGSSTQMSAFCAGPATLDDASRARLGIDLGPAVVGALPVKLIGKIGSGDHDSRLGVEADLTALKLDNILPGWVKLPGRSGKATFNVVQKQSSTRFEDIVVEGGGVSIKGSLEVDQNGDLLNANFIDDGDRIRIVDWEYAGMGDPWFDLGNFSINHELTPDEDAHLFAAYEGPARIDHLARLTLMRVVSDFREAMWGVLQQGISTLDVDFVAYAAEHFDRLLANASAPAFERALREAAGD